MLFRSQEDEVNARLKNLMVKAFHEVHGTATALKCDLRKAAMARSLQRLERAMLLRGFFP